MAYVAMPGMMQPGVMMVAPSNWTTSIFDCFQDVNSCIDVYFCYCCANARQYDAVAGIPDSMNIMILLANICLGTTYLINCCVRCNVAQRFNIDENNCLSCCCAMWLPSCSMCQTHRELTNRGLWPGGTLCSQPPVGYVPIVAPMGGMAVVSPMMAPQVVIQPQPVIYSTY